MTRDSRTCFGAPGSIEAARLFKLPLPMQAEGVRLLFEMGQTMEQVTGRLGLSTRQIRTMLALEARFARMGEHLPSIEGK